MENINESEQWKLSGDCSKCRRKPYCKTGCKKNDERTTAEVSRMIWGKIPSATRDFLIKYDKDYIDFK